MQKEWFADWFDSPYYHILYQKHDEADARAALDQLLHALHLKEGSRVLDLACGKGRHARYLADRGFDVTGLDISNQSIAFARQFEHDRLHFYQHDMRLPFRINYYDAVVNFFTSFGLKQSSLALFNSNAWSAFALELHMQGLSCSCCALLLPLTTPMHT